MSEPTTTDSKKMLIAKVYRQKIHEWFTVFKSKGRVQIGMPGTVYNDFVKWNKIKPESYERYLGQGWLKFIELKRIERVKEMIRWRILSQVIARCEEGNFTEEDWLGIVIEAKELCLLDYWRSINELKL